jgi:hypothetical protein
MDKLEFEHFEIRQGKVCLNDTDTPDQNERDVQAKAVETSVNIVKALEEKVKSFNRVDKSKRTTLPQLKRVFLEAVTSGENEKDKPVLGMARVNMFLRMKRDGVVAPPAKEEKEELEEITKIELEAAKDKKSNSNQLLNIASSWGPSEEDFELAKKDVEKYEIFRFNSVNDLYLEEYKALDVVISW